MLKYGSLINLSIESYPCLLFLTRNILNILQPFHISVNHRLHPLFISMIHLSCVYFFHNPIKHDVNTSMVITFLKFQMFKILFLPRLKRTPRYLPSLGIKTAQDLHSGQHSLPILCLHTPKPPPVYAWTDLNTGGISLKTSCPLNTEWRWTKSSKTWSLVLMLRNVKVY